VKFQQAALGGVLSVTLAMSAFAQAPDAAQQGDSDIVQPGDQGSVNPSGGSQPSQAQQAIMDVQSKLKDGGYFDGNVNGSWGPSSIAALQLYQQLNGLQPSGALDQNTAGSLGLSITEFAAFEAAVNQQPGAQGLDPQDPDSEPPTPGPDEDSDQSREAI
jgi:peptidoglycan hydrolase-like protein with peptidoglycan-binding domain